MKPNRVLGAAIVFSLGVATSATALANDTVVGALIGGAAGALVGHSVGGHDAMVTGGVLGAAAGAAIGSQSRRRHKSEHSAHYYPYPPNYRYSERSYSYPAQPTYYYESPAYYEAPPAVYYEPRRRGHRHDYRYHPMPVSMEIYDD